MYLLHTTIFAFIISATTGFPKEKGISPYPNLEDLLDSLLNLVNFFSDRYNKINVDGLFGVRFAQGEMIRALAKLDNGEYSPVGLQVREKMEKIRDICEQLCQRSLPEVKNQDVGYYNSFLPVIAKPWRVFELRPQRLKKMGEKFLPNSSSLEGMLLFDATHNFLTDSGPSLAVGSIHSPVNLISCVEINVDEESLFNEDKSDECMGSLLGTNGRKCNVDVCWELMTKPGSRLYYSTHQLLYFQLGLQNGCQMHFEQKVSELGGLEKILQGHCYNIIFQMETMFQHGTVKSYFQDVFLECGAVCAATGFVDALNITWFTEALKWQDKKLGCFKEHLFGGEWDDMQIQLEKTIGKQKDIWRKRNLLYDVEMGDQCSAHKSGVAAGYLAVHVRMFLEKVKENYRLPQALHPPQIHRETNSRKHSTSHLYFLSIAILAIVFLMIGHRRRSKLFRMLFRHCK